VNTYGLTALAAGMGDYVAALAKQGILAHPPTVAFGWRAREQILNQGPGGANRILVIPGDPQSGDAGTLVRGKLASVNPRTLLEHDEIWTLSIWGVDNTAPVDEGKQASAAKALLELAVQAVHNAVDPDTGDPVGVANLRWGSVRWINTTSTNLYFGRELQVRVTQKGPLFDQPYGVAYPDFAVSRELTE
jgi:hypothetical protein